MQKSKTFNGVTIKNIKFTGDWANYLGEQIGRNIKDTLYLFELCSSEVSSVLYHVEKELEVVSNARAGTYYDQGLVLRRLRSEAKTIRKYLHNGFPRRRGKYEGYKLANEIIDSTQKSQQQEYLKGLIESLEEKLFDLKLKAN